LFDYDVQTTSEILSVSHHMTLLWVHDAMDNRAPENEPKTKTTVIFVVMTAYLLMMPSHYKVLSLCEISDVQVYRQLPLPAPESISVQLFDGLGMVKNIWHNAY
jgi:hypothetical protein